jgi:hypothetical protein
MKTIIIGLLLLISSNLASAALYRCSKGGQTSYQERPCDEAATEVKTNVVIKESMSGCYEINYRTLDAGLPYSEKYEIRDIGNSKFELVDLKEKLEKKKSTSHRRIIMKQATNEALQQVGEGFGLDLKDGVSMDWEGGCKLNNRAYRMNNNHECDREYLQEFYNHKPDDLRWNLGFYRGRDQKGDEIIFAFLWLNNGIGKKIPCP